MIGLSDTLAQLAQNHTFAGMCRLLVASLILAATFLSRANGADAPDALLVLIGDQHSAYERTAQFVAHVERLKQENPNVPLAVLINGDSFEQGNVVAKRSSGEIELAMFAALARLAPTVLNLGNHEPEFYDPAQTVARVEVTGVRVVSNLADKTTHRFVAPISLRLPLGNAQAVIAGITTDQLAQYRAAIRPQLDLADPVVWAQQHFPTLFEGVAIPIVMSHAGLRHDRAMLSLVPDGTLFVGAHDHLLFTHALGRTMYVHSGSWNSHFSVARLFRDAAGARWTVEQVAIAPTDPKDPGLAKVIAAIEQKHLTPADIAVIGQTKRVWPRADAARWIARLVAQSAKVDAAFIGNTTFGAGLPAGDVTRLAFDACVRFDGSIWVARVKGAQLQRWLARANQGPETPFAERADEFLFAEGPTQINPRKTYRIATTDWGMKNRERYFGSADIDFEERPELRLKAIVAEALKK